MRQFFSIFSIACLITACDATKKAPSNDVNSNPLAGVKWRLTELYGKPVAEKINGKVPFLELQEVDKRYAASGGCNGIGGQFTLSKNGRIKFSQGMSTMMACENMEVETRLRDALIATDNYTINGNTLSLNKARMAPLARFQAVDPPVADNDLNGAWEVDYVSGIRIAFDGLYPDKKPVITFNIADNKASGNSSCNNFSATFTIDGSNIAFNDPMATKMACPGEGEAVFFKTLKTVTRYSVEGNTLNLIMGDIAVMRLQRK
ncbi:MAG: META domain-containing protein [Chitinophagaceae bacterium]|nr:META domain-containing protein [Chitinophagaceae bacterium]